MSTTNWLANGICQRLNSNKEDIYLPSPLQRLNPAAAAVDPWRALKGVQGGEWSTLCCREIGATGLQIVGYFQELISGSQSLHACMFSHSVMSNSFDSLDCSLPGSSFHGSFQARILEWVFISFLQGFFLTWDLNPQVLCLLETPHISYPSSDLLWLYNFHCQT